ncbi:protein ITPRID2 isoform X2 [Pyxicephalus adspersus]|uniref:protein ITPRID2 isoform X2 n=1 Tax=Pyxicephalus adspersus TaxID=30357 RepID=UPI003B58F10F
MDEAALEEAQARELVAKKRMAWAKSRDSWQASEAEDVSAETASIATAVQLGHRAGNIPNEKIAIWLNDCRTPLGASLDEQTNPTGFPKGMILKNGNSFEDDLSLGAEANHLHERNLPMEHPFGMLAKDRRLQFHQKGRSMNSTGSGKSSATVSSVSELLDLYEEDPEEVLYNLGFGRDEPDIASKIPSRFFNNSSFANGIDIKVFLNAQMQRLEVDNPNYALTSRFRQIKVLTDVANAFSSLYSQVSGTPLQRIGSSKSLTTPTTADPPKPAPLTRASSQTAARFMETLSKLNLCVNKAEGDAMTVHSPDEGGQSVKNNEEEGSKNEQKAQKLFKKNSSPLATVKEEASSSLVTDSNGHDISTISKENDVAMDLLLDPNSIKPEETSMNLEESSSSQNADSGFKELNISTDQDCGKYLTQNNPPTSTPDKGQFAPNPSITSLLIQAKESFELEELQSTEEEPSQVPPISQLATEKSKDNLLRTASQHSDSSGFAEDTSADCLLTNSLPVQDSLQAMGSSADSCDSETTVTSVGEDLRTPLAVDQRESIDLDDDEFLTPVDRKVFFEEKELNEQLLQASTPGLSQNEMCNTTGDLHFAVGDTQEISKQEAEIQQEETADGDLETQSDFEAISYTTHHISETLDSFSDYDSYPAFSRTDSSSVDRVNTALQRAQKKLFGSSETIGTRTGRSTVSSKDLLKRRHKFANSGYPLRRTQSLPSAISPVKVVSKVNIVLNSGKATVCSPPSFSYKYTAEEDESLEQIDEVDPTPKSTAYRFPVSDNKEAQKSNQGRVSEDPYSRSHSCTVHVPSHRSHSSCSLHSLQSDWHDRPLCEHSRTWSTHSVPNFSGSTCGSIMSPFSCSLNQRFAYGSPHRSCSGCAVPINAPPSTTEMQLRRVLHDIRSSLQNLSQHPIMRGNDMASASMYNTQRSSVLSLYENTFQELQIMRRSLNLFRTQMMDLELNMLRQQTMVYQHLSEDERYEADQLQGLRNSVRIELQELELQLDDRLLTLEDQLRNYHMSSPFQRQMPMGMYGGRGSTDSLLFTSPLNVIEPVTELIREQSHLKSELGLEDIRLEPGADQCDSVVSQAASDSSSGCSSLLYKNRKGPLNISDTVDKSKAQTPPSKAVYRASVALTPSPPVRANQNKTESSEEPGNFKLDSAEKSELETVTPSSDGATRWSPEESRELQQVIREIKESIVGDIRREIVSGLLAAVSSPIRSLDGKADGRI